MNFVLSLIIHLLVAVAFYGLPNRSLRQTRQNSVLWIQVEPGKAGAPSRHPLKALSKQERRKHETQHSFPFRFSPRDAHQPELSPLSHSNSQDISNASFHKEKEDYIALVRSKIDSYITYPAYLRRRRIFGEVKVRLILNSRGKIESFNMSESSGHEELDSLVLKAISAAEPFPSFDSELRKLGKLEMSLPVYFQLSPN